MNVLIWLTKRTTEERERKTLMSLRLQCLSHSHLHKDHVRRQSFTYLPFQSVTRMQYQQKTGKKEKECSPQRNWKKTMTTFSISAAYCVQRLRNGEKRENPDEVQSRTKGMSLQENLYDLLCLFLLVQMQPYVC